MSPRLVRRSHCALDLRSRSGESRGRWNRPASPTVVQGVGKRRGAAALLAACVVLSGCASGSGDEKTTTTSSPVAQTPTNPWDLPLEQRPPLFDPCEEIPVEAVEKGLASSVEKLSTATRHEPGSLMSCSWSSDEAIFGVLSTWKSREDYIADDMFTVEELDSTLPGKNTLLLTEPTDQSQSTCIHLFFTGLGTVMMSLDMTTSLNEFNGENMVEACEALAEVVAPVVPYIPEGEF